ncbi:MAG: OmpA family protein [Chitinophagaceae bacterium]|nr:OmpA family protein [Chitinophagaceae bacterium]
MKKVLSLFSAALFLFSSINAQDFDKSKPHVTAGFNGAVNLAQFNAKGTGSGPAGVEYHFKSDGLFGFWVNVPISQRFSFEPQLVFFSDRMNPQTGSSTDFDGKINYVGVPLLLKIHAGKYVAFPVGIQLDFRTAVRDYNGNFKRDDIQGHSVGATAGIEILPNARVSAFGRYVYGFTTVNYIANSARPYKLNNQNILAGIKVRLFDFWKKKKIVPPPPPPPPPPPKDSDGDGILDKDDKCPDVPGVAKYNGCPIPDTDKDGINDEEDKCPTVPGVPEYDGCPVPDRDKDGIPDDKDKCPDVAGVASQQGCPEITEEVTKRVEYAAKKIYFNTNSTKLRSASYAALNDVIKILNENKSVKLKIDGHTDSDGSDAFNLKLSDGRAASVKKYLVSKGIDESRLVSEGFGESQPIASNKTAAGKQKNRRVEMKLFY